MYPNTQMELMYVLYLLQVFFNYVALLIASYLAYCGLSDCLKKFVSLLKISKQILVRMRRDR